MTSVVERRPTAQVFAAAAVPPCPKWTAEWDADPPGRVAIAVDDGQRTLLLAGDGRRVRAVASARTSDPGQLSPDGTRLAMVVDYPGPHVLLLDLLRGGRRSCPAVVPGTEVLAWMPSGRRLIYGGESSMYVLDLATGLSEPYDLAGAEPREVAVAPPGDRIAIDVGDRVWIAPITGGVPVGVRLAPGGWLGAQAWSPDSSLLVVCHAADTAADRGEEPELAPGRDDNGRRSTRRGRGAVEEKAFNLVLTFLESARDFRPVGSVVVPGMLGAGFVGWRDPRTVVLVERAEHGYTRVVLRGLDGVELGQLTRLDVPVWEVRAASELLRVVGTGPEGEIDVGTPPRWRRRGAPSVPPQRT